MKKIFFILLCIVLIIITVTFIACNSQVNKIDGSFVMEEDCTDGLYFSLVSPGYYVVTGYDGVDTEVVIPSKIGGMPVKAIADEAFKSTEGDEVNCNITSIVIPNSVTSIGNSAFMGCSSLSAITIPGSVLSIGNWAFSYCKKLSSVVISEGVISIGEYAFYRCSWLDDITIPDSVTSIGYEAFGDTPYYNNKQNWENGALYIGNHLIDTDEMFSDQYVVKQGCVSIADSAFSDCDNLTSITINMGLRSIGKKAFYCCSNLINITVPNSIVTIGESAFVGTNYFNNSSNWQANVLYIGEHLIKADVSIDERYEVKINCVSIADKAFEGCNNLNSVILSSNLKNIGSFAFYNCGNLSQITIPSSVENIMYGAFDSCDRLKVVSYLGTELQWKNTCIGAKNSDLTSADIICNYGG